MKRLRVVVVEDSRTVRERLVEVLATDPDFEVVGQIGDGLAALRLCEAVKPDVISLDMVLPGMNGLEVTRQIMSTRATPILVVSASANRGEAFDALDALQAGAVDIFDKSRMGRDSDWSNALKDALRLVARIRVVTRPLSRTLARSVTTPFSERKPALKPVVEETELPIPMSGVNVTKVRCPGGPRAPLNLLVLGASTGGPAAIAQLLTGLPDDFSLPMLIVLHLSPLFATSLAEWLGRHTSRCVRLAIDGETIPSPAFAAPVILAPPDRHLIVEAGKLHLVMRPERHSCRPSVDVLFESVARELGPRTVAGLLTGMGKDGATGLLALRQAHALTFAQDEATSVVFGMPQEAIRIGAAEMVLSLNEMASRLVGVLRTNEERSAV